MTPRYGRAYGGQRAVSYAPYQRGHKLSILSAISVRKVEAAMYLQGSANGEVFKHFLEHHLCPVLKHNHVVIMDNVSFHKIQMATDLIESKGARVLYLPPYHPELNPIEEMWSKLKNRLRHLKARTLPDFKKAIKKSFLQISQSDLQGWFQHAGL